MRFLVDVDKLERGLTYFHANRFTLSARGLRYGLLADYAKSQG